MHEMSVFWLRAAVALYSVGLLHALWTVLARRTQMFGVAFAAFSTATVLHLVSIVERSRLIGHFPVDNFFETSSLCALLIAAGFLFFNWRYGFRSLGVFLFPLVFILALAGSMGEPVETWTNPRVRDAWLVAHIVFVLTGYAALLMTAVASIFYLIEERQLKRKLTSRLFDRLPPLGTIDTMINRAMGVGFLLITLATVTGSMWAFIESGTSWIADGRVGIALATWLLWLVMVFLRTAAGWRGRRTAVMALAIVGCSAVTWAAHVGLRPALMR
jgi:ABC-type transport system involved in cytochrome c biogenesis permease subunit